MIENIQQIQTYIDTHPVLFFTLIIWSMVWKGYALWKAARLSHSKWFVIMLVINTLGILDIIYLYFVAKKYTVVSETE